MMRNPIILQEHQPFENPSKSGNGRDYSLEKNELQKLSLPFCPTDYLGEPRFLGIDPSFRASYYIGAAWLVKNEWSVIVTPKMTSIDFVTMFLAALEVDTQKESDYFSKCYGIQFDEPVIETNEQLNQLTPLLVLHFITLLERLVKHGLKKDYVIREENLKAKVKGRILFSKHLQKNIFQRRDDRVFCQYQEYTEDIPENRLLKKALLFAKHVINSYESLKKQLEHTQIKQRLNHLESRFQFVSDDIEPYQIQHLSTNKLFRDYREAIRVAKMLLRRFDYSIAKAASEPQKTPPFWIDMARLYEMYVYSKLSAAYGSEIAFQVKGHFSTAVDFIKRDELIILDTKYKPKYENSNPGIINDIREMSGYARDTRILRALGADEQEVKCVIIYPEPQVFKEDKENTEEENMEIRGDDCQEIRIFNGADIIPQCSKIKQFRGFYKISVPLPTDGENG